MFGLLIDPFQKSVEYIEGEIRELSWLYEKLSCDTIDVIQLGDCDGHDLILDDNGLLKQPSEQAYFAINGNILSGRALVVRTNPEGDSIEPSINQADLWKLVKWIPHEVGVAFAAQFQ